MDHFDLPSLSSSHASAATPASGTEYPPHEEVLYPVGDDNCVCESTIHFRCITYIQGALETWFRTVPEVFVAGNLNVYYERGRPEKVVRPDVMAVFGASQEPRLSWLPWNEGGRLPDFVLEVTSRSTEKRDREEKLELYASMGVREYFQYDPLGTVRDPALQGLRLEQGVYRELALETGPDGRPCIPSELLSLSLCDFRDEEILRLYDPEMGRYLPTLWEATFAERQLRAAYRKTAKRLREEKQLRCDIAWERLSEETARKQETAAREAAEAERDREAAAREAAEAERDQEAAAREAAEARVAALEAKLREAGGDPSDSNDDA